MIFLKAQIGEVISCAKVLSVEVWSPPPAQIRRYIWDSSSITPKSEDLVEWRSDCQRAMATKGLQYPSDVGTPLFRNFSKVK